MKSSRSWLDSVANTLRHISGLPGFQARRHQEPTLHRAMRSQCYGENEQWILSEFQLRNSHIFSSHRGLGDLPFHRTFFFDEESEHFPVDDARGGVVDFEPVVAVVEFFDSPLQKKISWVRSSLTVSKPLTFGGSVPSGRLKTLLGLRDRSSTIYRPAKNL
jgi:hypothetical protein